MTEEEKDRHRAWLQSETTRRFASEQVTRVKSYFLALMTAAKASEDPKVIAAYYRFTEAKDRLELLTGKKEEHYE